MTAQDQLGPYTIVGKLTQRDIAFSCAASIAIRPRVERLAMIHVLDSSLLGNDAWRARLIETTNRALLLRHPNVLEAFDYAERDNVHYIVTEFAQGVPLSSLLGHPNLSPVMAAYILSQVAVGVAHAHTRRDDAGNAVEILHGDIRPEHIWIGDNGAVKIGGFAIGGARSESAHDPIDDAQQDRDLYAFASASRARHATPTQADDVFAMAAILWSILADKPLYAGAQSAHVRALAEAGDIPDITAIRPDLDADLVRIVLRGLGQTDGNDQAITSAQTLRTQLSSWLRAQDARIGRPEVKSAFDDVLTLPDTLTAQRPMAFREFKPEDPYSKIHEVQASDNDASTVDISALATSAALLDNGHSLSSAASHLPASSKGVTSDRPRQDSKRVEATTQIVDSISAVQSQHPDVSLKPPKPLGKEPTIREDLATVQVNAVDAVASLPPSLRNKPERETVPASKPTGSHVAAVSIDDEREVTKETPSVSTDDTATSGSAPQLPPPTTPNLPPATRPNLPPASKPSLPPSTNPNLPPVKPSARPSVPTPPGTRTGTQLISSVPIDEDDDHVSKLENARKGTQLISPEKFDEEDLDDAPVVVTSKASSEPSIRVASLTAQVAAVPSPQESEHAETASDWDDDPELDAPREVSDPIPADSSPSVPSHIDATPPSHKGHIEDDFDPTAIYDEETYVPDVEEEERITSRGKQGSRNPIIIALVVIIIGLVAYFVYDRSSGPQDGQESLAAIPAALTVQSTPGRASIFLNNEDTGMVTPHTFTDLDASTPVSVRVARSGYEEVAGKTVSLKSGETSDVDFTLEALTHTINFSTQPEGATVYLDGEEVPEKTPTIVGPFEANPALGVNITIRLDGYKPKSIQHTWKPGERTSDIDLTLDRR